MLSTEFKEMIDTPSLHQLSAPLTGEYDAVPTTLTSPPLIPGPISSANAQESVPYIMQTSIQPTEKRKFKTTQAPKSMASSMQPSMATKAFKSMDPEQSHEDPPKEKDRGARDSTEEKKAAAEAEARKQADQEVVEQEMVEKLGEKFEKENPELFKKVVEAEVNEDPW